MGEEWRRNRAPVCFGFVVVGETGLTRNVNEFVLKCGCAAQGGRCEFWNAFCGGVVEAEQMDQSSKLLSLSISQQSVPFRLHLFLLLFSLRGASAVMFNP